MLSRSFGIVLITVFVLLLPGCLTTPPEWIVSGQDPAYPDATWITGIGRGKSPSDARRQALGFLVRRIRETVSVSTESMTHVTNLKKIHVLNNEIRTSSSIALQNVEYPRLVMVNRHWYALAALNRRSALETAKRKLGEDLQKRSEMREDLSHLSFFRKIVLLKKTLPLDRVIERDRELVAVFGGSLDGIDPYYQDKRILDALIYRYMTFYARIEDSGSLGNLLIQRLTESGLRKTSDLAKASFILQGGFRSAFVIPPTNSPYFWIGYSLALSLSDIRSGNTIIERSDSGMSSGLDRAQARINMERFVLQQDIDPFVKKLSKNILFEK